MTPPSHNLSGWIPYCIRVLLQPPSAVAEIRGSAEYSSITGSVYFYQTSAGVLVCAQIFGLPVPDTACENYIFAFHIHSGGACTGNPEDPFADVGAHYNPGGCSHPGHAGDLLPLWGNQGSAFEIFLTDRFRAEEIIGKAVIIHRKSDDFTTQPSGNAGAKIACGEIQKFAPQVLPPKGSQLVLKK